MPPSGDAASDPPTGDAAADAGATPPARARKPAAKKKKKRSVARKRAARPKKPKAVPAAPAEGATPAPEEPAAEGDAAAAKGRKPAGGGGRRRYQVPTNTKGKAVVIVESPAKARTINRYLGNGYVVAASMGHVRDLPKSKLGVDPEHGFAVTYVPIPDRADHVLALKRATDQARMVYLAPDPDREGEAIAWHLMEALELPPEKVRRVTFNEITKRAIEQAFQHPSEIAMSRVYAQQARRVLDRIVGYYLSPLLWSKVIFGLSAGRVQSVAVRLIVEREREIRAFVPEEYWTVTARCRRTGDPADAPDAPGVDFQLREWEGAKADIRTGAQASAIAAALRGAAFTVAEIRRTERIERARPPFTTSTLQQQASIRLRFATKRTMRIAQQLYEGLPIGEEGPTGLITYMRTDSVRVADEARVEARELIAQRYGAESVPAEPNAYKESAKAQAAHEAVRPTSVARTPEVMSRWLNADQLRLYTLIWQRFVASQMAPARIATTQVRVAAGPGVLTAEGREVLFAGHHAALRPPRTDEPELPGYAEGEALTAAAVEPAQHFTQPSPRYSEATLVKQLEKNGIGRPSTYAPIISTVQARGYVTLEQRRFHATPIGELVTDLLVKHFPTILDVEFTSTMESRLDTIEGENADWVDVLEKFHDVFARDLSKAKKQMRDYKKHPDPSDHTCPACGKPMVYRVNKRGKYLGCSTYPKCSHTIPLDAAGNPVAPKVTDVDCVRCGKKMLLRHGRQGMFLGCQGWPDCATTMPVDEAGNPLFRERNGEPCPECARPMLVRSGRRGPFLACTGYPECSATKPLGEEANRPDPGLPCKLCGKPTTWRRGRRGLFLGCTDYPTCKGTRPAPKQDRVEQAEALLAEVNAPANGDEVETEDNDA